VVSEVFLCASQLIHPVVALLCLLLYLKTVNTTDDADEICVDIFTALLTRYFWAASLQGRKPGVEFGGTMTDCFRVHTSYSQNWPC